MNITIVQGAFLPVPPLRGGAVEKVWSSLGREFCAQGHSVTHVSRHFESLPESEVLDGVQHVRVRGFDASRSLILLKALDFAYSMRVLQKLKPADVLVSNTFWLPVFVRSRKYGVLYVHVARYPRGQMNLYTHADRLQTVTQPIVQAILAESCVAPAKVKAIPYPIKVQAWSNEDHVLPRNKEILFVGRIHPEKGVHLLIEAFQLLVNQGLDAWTLTVVGPTEICSGGGGTGYLAKLRSLAESLGDRVSMVGPVFQEEELQRFSRRASLFVYPSLAERGETFGLAPLEAMASGCPAIVSALSCFSEYITDDETGFVFNHRASNPVRELADRIRMVIQNPERLESISRAARITALNYSITVVAKMYLDDFQILLRDEEPVPVAIRR